MSFLALFPQSNASDIEDPFGDTATFSNAESLSFSDASSLAGVMNFLAPLVLIGIAIYAGGSLWKYVHAARVTTLMCLLRQFGGVRLGEVVELTRYDVCVCVS